MGRPRKDAKYLNVYVSRDVYNDFTMFCQDIGQSKSLAAERAIKAYMESMTSLQSGMTKKETEKGTNS